MKQKTEKRIALVAAVVVTVCIIAIIANPIGIHN